MSIEGQKPEELYPTEDVTGGGEVVTRFSVGGSVESKNTGEKDLAELERVRRELDLSVGEGAKKESFEKIEITTATPEDARRIYEIKKQSWLDTYSASEYGLSRGDIEQKDFFGKVEKLAGRIQSGEAIGFVAKSNGVIIGYCTGVKKEDFNVLHAFHILKDFQGRGIGKQLIEGVLNWLGEDKPIVVDVAEQNERAIKIYEKYGFVKDELSDKDTMETFPNGKQIINHRMIRPAKSKEVKSP